MTVKELIAILQQQNPEALVVREDYGSDFKIVEARGLRPVDVRLLDYKGLAFVQYFSDAPPQGERWVKYLGAVDAVLLE